MNTEKRIHIIGDRHTGVRLDVVAAEVFEVGRRKAGRWIEDGLVLVNGRCTAKGVRLREGQELTLQISRKTLPAATIVKENKRLLVAAKPAGLPCTSDSPDPQMEDSLMGRMVGRFAHLREVSEYGLLHRLDNGTSGVVLIASHEASYEALRHEVRSAEKTYYCIVDGAPTLEEVSCFIAHKPRDPARMVCLERGEEARGKAQPAHSNIEVLSQNNGISLVRARIRQGKRHQVRLHLAFAGAPIVGDPLYGSRSYSRLLLHAHSVELEGEQFCVAPDEEFCNAVQEFGLSWSKE